MSPRSHLLRNNLHLLGEKSLPSWRHNTLMVREYVHRLVKQVSVFTIKGKDCRRVPRDVNFTKRKVTISLLHIGNTVVKERGKIPSSTYLRMSIDTCFTSDRTRDPGQHQSGSEKKRPIPQPHLRPIGLSVNTDQFILQGQTGIWYL